MITLALPLVAAAAILPEVRTFWAVEPGPRPQPTQVEVHARLVREGRTVAVYEEEGYRFSSLGPTDEARSDRCGRQRRSTRRSTPERWRCSGPCPDRDHNGKVILLVTHAAPSGGLFLAFDEMAEAEALRYGFHSNEGEVLFHTFDRQGNRAGLEHPGGRRDVPPAPPLQPRPRRDRVEPPARQLHAVSCAGLRLARLLWGDLDPEGRAHAPGGPLDLEGAGRSSSSSTCGTSSGAESLRDLALRPETGVAGLAQLLADGRPPDARRSPRRTSRWRAGSTTRPSRMGASRSRPWCPRARCLRLGRPRPVRPPARWRSASEGWRSSSWTADGERPFPLTLQGDPSARWVARAVELRRVGPDRELPLDASPPPGSPSSSFPTSRPARGSWWPRSRSRAIRDVRPSHPAAALGGRLGAARPGGPGPREAGRAREEGTPGRRAAARTRLMETVDRLGGFAAAGVEGPVVSTRYAWAPGGSGVVEVLEQEAGAGACRSALDSSAPCPERHPAGVVERPRRPSRERPTAVARGPRRPLGRRPW